MKKTNKNIFFFMPLATIGGTEMVHLDVLKALKDYHPEVYIRYSSNIWKGREYASKPDAKEEGKAMLPEFSKYSKVKFADAFLEAPRFGRLVRKIFINYLARKINRCKNPVVIFWNREAIEFLLPHLKNHVQILDIVHNNSNDDQPDPKYLVNDWVPRINQRILVSEGLKKWLNPLYQKENYPEEYYRRMKTIEHSVHFPSEGYISKEINPVRVLFIGRDSHEKRFSLFLEIGKRLITGEIPFEIHIVGPLAKDHPDFVGDRFKWHGELRNRKQIEEIYRKMNFLIITSSSEGFPKVIAEAMAFSCIPISTRVGDIDQHIISGKNGYLTDPEKCVEETLSILYEIVNDPVKYLETAQNSYLYAEQKFAEERFKNEWIKVIDSLN